MYDGLTPAATAITETGRYCVLDPLTSSSRKILEILSLQLQFAHLKLASYWNILNISIIQAISNGGGIYRDYSFEIFLGVRSYFLVHRLLSSVKLGFFSYSLECLLWLSLHVEFIIQDVSSKTEKQFVVSHCICNFWGSGLVQGGR